MVNLFLLLKQNFHFLLIKSDAQDFNIQKVWNGGRKKDERAAFLFAGPTHQLENSTIHFALFKAEFCQVSSKPLLKEVT